MPRPARSIVVPVLTALALAAGGTSTAVPAVGTADAPQPSVDVTAPSSHRLDLGAENLPESRTATQIAPGVTWTFIERGSRDIVESNDELFWTVEVTIPSGDPDVQSSPLGTQAEAEAVAQTLADAGVTARVEPVDSPKLADAGGHLGYRVRAGEFATSGAAQPVAAQVRSAGYAASVQFTGYDGDTDDVGETAGRWAVNVLTIDPAEFRGDLSASFGENLEHRTLTSEMAADAGALAAVNAGFFVFTPSAGAEGDPAGAGAYAGEVLSEAVGDRPVLTIDGRKGEVAVDRVTWRGSVRGLGTDELRLDGINRVPGLIRNCGGIGDEPTDLPLHDFTCTDDDETVAFTPEFGERTPSGEGLEVLVDDRGFVTSVRQERGHEVPSGGFSVQAIGDDVDDLSALVEGSHRLRLTTELVDERSKAVNLRASDHVVNGGPLLIDDGRAEVTAARDGMVHADNPGFFYAWGHKRHPRTIAGIDDAGRTVLITVDGRQADTLGLSLQEAADVARSLGLVEAINLDGGGSTTMVVGDEIVNSPSGGAERAIGDAVLVLPR